MLCRLRVLRPLINQPHPFNTPRLPRARVLKAPSPSASAFLTTKSLGSRKLQAINALRDLIARPIRSHDLATAFHTAKRDKTLRLLSNDELSSLIAYFGTLSDRDATPRVPQNGPWSRKPFCAHPAALQSPTANHWQLVRDIAAEKLFLQRQWTLGDRFWLMKAALADISKASQPNRGDIDHLQEARRHYTALNRSCADPAVHEPYISSLLRQAEKASLVDSSTPPYIQLLAELRGSLKVLVSRPEPIAPSLQMLFWRAFELHFSHSSSSSQLELLLSTLSHRIDLINGYVPAEKEPALAPHLAEENTVPLSCDHDHTVTELAEALRSVFFCDSARLDASATVRFRPRLPQTDDSTYEPAPASPLSCAERWAVAELRTTFSPPLHAGRALHTLQVLSPISTSWLGSLKAPSIHTDRELMCLLADPRLRTDIVETEQYGEAIRIAWGSWSVQPWYQQPPSRNDRAILLGFLARANARVLADIQKWILGPGQSFIRPHDVAGRRKMLDAGPSSPVIRSEPIYGVLMPSIPALAVHLAAAEARLGSFAWPAVVRRLRALGLASPALAQEADLLGIFAAQLVRHLLLDHEGREQGHILPETLSRNAGLAFKIYTLSDEIALMPEHDCDLIAEIARKSYPELALACLGLPQFPSHAKGEILEHIIQHCSNWRLPPTSAAILAIELLTWVRVQSGVGLGGKDWERGLIILAVSGQEKRATQIFISLVKSTLVSTHLSSPSTPNPSRIISQTFPNVAFLHDFIAVLCDAGEPRLALESVQALPDDEHKAALCGVLLRRLADAGLERLYSWAKGAFSQTPKPQAPVVVHPAVTPTQSTSVSRSSSVMPTSTYRSSNRFHRLALDAMANPSRNWYRYVHELRQRIGVLATTARATQSTTPQSVRPVEPRDVTLGMRLLVQVGRPRAAKRLWAAYETYYASQATARHDQVGNRGVQKAAPSTLEASRTTAYNILLSDKANFTPMQRAIPLRQASPSFRSTRATPRFWKQRRLRDLFTVATSLAQRGFETENTTSAFIPRPISPDRITGNILLKGMLNAKKNALDSRVLRSLFDQVWLQSIRSEDALGTGAPTASSSNSSVLHGEAHPTGLGIDFGPFGNRRDPHPNALFAMPPKMSFKKHERPLFRMFMRAFRARGDRDAYAVVRHLYLSRRATAEEIPRTSR